MVGHAITLKHSSNSAFQRNQVESELDAEYADYDTVADVVVMQQVPSQNNNPKTGDIKLTKVYNSTVTDDLVTTSSDNGVELSTDWNLNLAHNVFGREMGVVYSKDLVAQDNNVQGKLDIDGGEATTFCCLRRVIERGSCFAPLPKQWWTCPS